MQFVEVGRIRKTLAHREQIVGRNFKHMFADSAFNFISREIEVNILSYFRIFLD
ncbi:hypothetical protein [Rhodoferax sp.]|uniref:hypothetical protein n=1 Tax=Rhodoferax sp. TaxID=50421 RepID=UPI003A0FD6F7